MNKYNASEVLMPTLINNEWFELVIEIEYLMMKYIS